MQSFGLLKTFNLRTNNVCLSHAFNVIYDFLKSWAAIFFIQTPITSLCSYRLVLKIDLIDRATRDVLFEYKQCMSFICIQYVLIFHKSWRNRAGNHCKQKASTDCLHNLHKCEVEIYFNQKQSSKKLQTPFPTHPPIWQNITVTYP